MGRSARGRLAGVLLAALLPAACGKPAATAPEGGGPLARDSVIVMDEYAYSSAACAEVAPPGGADSAVVPAARLIVVSTACWSAVARIEDSLGVPVRTLRARFAVPNRSDGDKDRGAEGYLPWDGRDDSGAAAPPGEYLWRVAFDFGQGRSLRWRAITAITATGGP